MLRTAVVVEVTALGVFAKGALLRTAFIVMGPLVALLTLVYVTVSAGEAEAYIKLSLIA